MDSAPGWRRRPDGWCSKGDAPKAASDWPHKRLSEYRLPITASNKDTSFRRNLRLIRTADFSIVFKNGDRSSDALFTVLGRNNQLGYARLGMAISVKAAGNAVRRNRLKRSVRESFHLVHATLPAIDFVVMAKPAAAGTERSKLTQSLDRHWQKVSKKCAV
jgi:ribonuclease P protein component